MRIFNSVILLSDNTNQGAGKHPAAVVRARGRVKSTCPTARRARWRVSFKLACKHLLYVFIGSAENRDFQV